MKKASDLLEITSLVTENVFRSRYIWCVCDVCVCERERRGSRGAGREIKDCYYILGDHF